MPHLEFVVILVQLLLLCDGGLQALVQQHHQLQHLLLGPHDRLDVCLQTNVVSPAIISVVVSTILALEGVT